MKKILQRIGIAAGVFAVVIIVAIVALTRGEKGPDYEIVTDAAGMTYIAYEDKENNTTYAVVTDEDGNRYAAQFDGNTVGSTVANINNRFDADSIPTNFTGEHIDVTAGTNDYKGEIVTQAPQVTDPTAQTSANQDPTQPTTQPNSQSPEEPTSGNQQTPQVSDPTQQPTTQTPTQQPQTGLTAYRINKYQQIFAGGTYLMEMTTNDPDLGESPICMAVKNGNMYIDTTMEGMRLKMLYKKDKKTMYLIIDEFKKYCKLPDDLMGEDMDMESMMSGFSISDVGNVTAQEVELNGQKLILETYAASDGSTVNYYFDGEALVRRDSISPDGTVDSIFISRFTTDVPDSTFEIPDGYGYLNLSWLGAMM